MPREKSNLPFFRVGGEGSNPYQYPMHNAQPSGSIQPPYWVLPTSPSVAMARSAPSSGWGAFVSPEPSPEEMPSRSRLVDGTHQVHQQFGQPSAGAQALRSSCRFCRTRKIKCPGGAACQTCVSRGIACIYDGKSKMGRPPLLRKNTKEKQNRGISSTLPMLDQFQTSASFAAPLVSPPLVSPALTSPGFQQAARGTYFDLPVQSHAHSLQHLDQPSGSMEIPFQGVFTPGFGPTQPQHADYPIPPSEPLQRSYSAEAFHPGQQDGHHPHQYTRESEHVYEQQHPGHTPYGAAPSSLPVAPGPPARTSAGHDEPFVHEADPHDLTIGTTATLFFFELFEATEAFSVYAAAVQAWRRAGSQTVSPDHPEMRVIPQDSSVSVYQGTMRWIVKDCIEGTVALMTRLDIPRSVRYAVRLAGDRTSSMELDAGVLAQSEGVIAELSALPSSAKQNLFQSWMDSHPCASLLTSEQQQHLPRWESPVGWAPGWQALQLLVLAEAMEWKSGYSPQSVALVTRAEKYFWQLKMGVSQRDDAFLTLIAALFAWHHICHFREKRGSVYLALACHLPNSGTFSRGGPLAGKLSLEESEKLALLQTVLNCQAIWTFMQLGTNDAELLRMMRFELERMWTMDSRQGTGSPVSRDSRGTPPLSVSPQPVELQGFAREIRNTSQTIILTARLTEMYLRSQQDWSADRVARDLEVLLRSQLKLSISKTLPIENLQSPGRRDSDEGLSLFDEGLHDTLSLAFRFLRPASTHHITPEETVSILQDCLAMWSILPQLQSLISEKRDRNRREQFHLNPPSPKTAMQGEKTERNRVKHRQDLNSLLTLALVHIRISIHALDRLGHQRNIHASTTVLRANVSASAGAAGPAASSAPNSIPSSPRTMTSPEPTNIAALSSDTLACLDEGLALFRRAAPDKLFAYQRQELESLEREFAKVSEKLAGFASANGPSSSDSLTTLWPSPRSLRGVKGPTGRPLSIGSSAGSASGFSPKSHSGSNSGDRSGLLSLGPSPPSTSSNPSIIGARQVSPPPLLPHASGIVQNWSSGEMEGPALGSNGSPNETSINSTCQGGPGRVIGGVTAPGDVSMQQYLLGRQWGPQSRLLQSAGDGLLAVPPAISAERKTSIVWDSFWGSLNSLRSSWSAASSGTPPGPAPHGKPAHQRFATHQLGAASEADHGDALLRDEGWLR